MNKNQFVKKAEEIIYKSKNLDWIWQEYPTNLDKEIDALYQLYIEGVREIIGEDESWRKEKQENGLMYMTGRNDLRAEQREKLKK